MTTAAWRRRFLAPRVSRPSWALDAPDKLLYASNASGKWELCAWDRQADVHRQVTDRPQGTLPFYAQISRSGEWIWWFDDEKGNEFGRWMVEPFDGGRPRLAAPDLPPSYWAGLAIGRSFAILGSSTDGGVAVYLVRDGEGPRLLYRHREAADVAGLSRDEELVCISHSEHGDSRHPSLRVLDLGGNTVADLWDGPGLGLWAADWSPVPADRRLLVLHERNDLPRPLIWTPETDEVVVPAIDLPGEIAAAWYPDASALLLTHAYRGRDELYRLDLSSGALDRIDVEPGTISGAAIRPDGELWYTWSRSSTPPEIRADTGVVLRPPGEAAPGGVSYADHDVEGVPVFLAEPEGSRPHPTIFQIHGGPPAADWDEFSPFVQAWVDHGFAVVLVNYRGSTGYGKAWRDALEGNPGLTELQDIGKVRDWVVACGVAQEERVILSGASWGGYLTLLGLGTQPERWSLGIGRVPVADYIASFEDQMEPLKRFDSALFGGTPQEIPDIYRERSPITYVQRVRAPVMILAGENDMRCPIRQVENYITRLRELGKPHEVYRYDAGHGSLVTEETIRQVEAQLTFAARYLGTMPPR